MTNAKHYVMASALAVVMITGSTSIATAHGFMDCYRDGANFCDAAHGPGTAARQACRASVQQACASHHPHPGGAPPAPDPNMTSDPGYQLNKKKGFKVRRR